MYACKLFIKKICCQTVSGAGSTISERMKNISKEWERIKKNPVQHEEWKAAAKRKNEVLKRPCELDEEERRCFIKQKMIKIKHQV